MDFEYDPPKSEANKIRHGIDFEEAKELWKDPCAVIIPSEYQGEDRFLVIGEIELKGWTAIITFRGEIVRIISVRRSRDYEAEAYNNRRRAG